jgi:hypothetical protein
MDLNPQYRFKKKSNFEKAENSLGSTHTETVICYIEVPFINSDLLYRGALWSRFDWFIMKSIDTINWNWRPRRKKKQTENLV